MSSVSLPQQAGGTHHLFQWVHRHRRALIAALVIMLAEVSLFNLPFWTSLAKPGAVSVTPADIRVGDGLSDTPYGEIVTVTEAETATVTVTNINKPLDTVRLLPTGATPPDSSNTTKRLYGHGAPAFTRIVTARIDTLPVGSTMWITGQAHEYAPQSPSSGYVQLTEEQRASEQVFQIRVTFLQAQNTSFAYAGLTLNSYPGFSLKPIRLGVFALFALLVIAFRPTSRLYRLTFSLLATRTKRLMLAGAILPFIGLIIGLIIGQWGHTLSTDFAEFGDYTYDFDQYALTADSLFHGHAWLNLPVPDQLSSAANPYSVLTRTDLLSQGVTPIFWDHAYFDGRLYNYFGLLPVLVFYLPYQAITSLWVPGGLALASPIVVAVLLALLALAGILLVTRLIGRSFPGASVGITLLSSLGFLCGSTLFFLAFRMNFYAIPMLTSLVLTCFALWFWLGTVRNGRISKTRLAAGFILMAANLGGRPTFILASMLALVIFWPQIASGRFFSYLNPGTWRTRRSWRDLWASLPTDLAALIPAAVTCLPFLAYNLVRFGSLLDFGNDYQLTLTDLTTYREPLSLIVPITYYYLFQPLGFTTRFPGLELTNTPLSEWQMTEPHAGGFFWLVPFAILGLVALFLRRILRPKRLWGCALTLLSIAAILCVFDAYKAGLSWRYMGDFGWAIALVAVMAACGLEEYARGLPDSGRSRIRAVGWARVGVAVLVIAGIAILLSTAVMPGRIDNLETNAPGAYFEIREAFTGWIPR